MSPITEDPAYWANLAKAVLDQLPPVGEDDAPPEVVPCPVCGGSGWVRRMVPLDDPAFGKAFPCACVGDDRAQRSLDRKVKLAGLDGEVAGWTFATYRALPGADLTTCDAVEAWAREGRGSLLLFGKVGRGKTGLAVPAFRQRIAEGRAPTYLYVRSIDLFRRLWASHRQGAEQHDDEITAALCECALLLLDDLGVELEGEHPSAYVLTKLYEIVGERHFRGRATIFTTNLSLGELERKITERTYWRILEMCEPDLYLMEGANLRDRRRAEGPPRGSGHVDGRRKRSP